MPRKNPLFDPVGREIEEAIGGSMVVVDRWFDEIRALRTEVAMVNELKEELVARISKDKGRGVETDVEALKEANRRISHLKREMKILDRRIAKFYKASFKDLAERLDTIKAIPGSGVYAREYRDAMRMLTLAKNRSQFAHVDLRPQISQLRGAVKTLEDATSRMRPTGLEVGLAGARARLRPTPRVKKTGMSVGDRYEELVGRWKDLQARAKASSGYKRGVSKIAAIEREDGDPRSYRDADIRFTLATRDIDLLARILKRRIERGEPGQEKNLKNLKEKMDILSSMMGEGIRQKTMSPEAVISKIGKLRKDLIAKRKSTRRSPKDLAKMRERLEALKGQAGVKMTKGWSEQDRRNVRAGLRESQALLDSMEPVSLPSKTASRLGIPPSRKHRVSSKAIAKRTGNPKKKSKKKASKKRVKTSDSQRLIRRCQKLWDHYCERPGKKRLQDVLKHVEKMKESTSKKVLDERKQCLRAANAEAKRLKLKK